MHTTPDQEQIANTTSLDRAHHVCPAFRFRATLPATGKCALYRGEVEGNPAIAKVLLSTENRWINRFRHEVRFYQHTSQGDTPVHIPAMYAGDKHELVLVMEYMDGDPMATGRYRDQDIDRDPCDHLVRTISAVSEWRPWSVPSSKITLGAFKSTLAKGVTADVIAASDAGPMTTRRCLVR